ncbi:hypothetical protein [Nostoc sp. FACHB-133]|uniref:hypothetical protein n=1 Tax=Nostoc sp. FACHB-133 TaxID=2692835 RepID=UPI001A7EC99F|nr:hypothetical protein [Nostoc sp. FACHB-133]
MRKESHSLHSRSNFISTIQTKPPLVKSSKFFLSRQYEPSIEPLIGWDSWDTQDITSDFSEFPLIEFDASDSIATLDNSNESVKNSIPKIMPTPAEKNTSNGTSQEVNIETKSQPKKTNKSQKRLKKEPKSKSKTKKAIKSSSPKNFEPIVDKTNINLNKDNLLISDESMPIEANLETPDLQLDIVLDTTTKDHSSVSSPTVDTSPSLQDQSTLFENFATDDLSENSELISSFSSKDLSLTENTLTSEENIELEDDTSELVNSSSIEIPSKKNTEKIFIPDSNFTDNEEKLIPEVSESVNLSGMQVSQTPPQQDIERDQVPSIVDNKSSVSQTNLIQAKEILPTLNSLSQEEKLPNINTKFEEVTAIDEADLISEKSTNDFVTDNSASDNSLTLSSALTSSEVDDSPTLLHSLENDENTVETDVISPNSESSVAKNPITVRQEIDPDFSHNVEKATQNLIPQPPLLEDNGEILQPLSFQDQGFLDSMKSQEIIDSSVTSESPDIAPVQLIPTSAVIEDTPSLFSTPDSDEQLVTSESQSAMVVNVSDVSGNVTSLQRDSNVQNPVSEFTESQPILAAPEIAEAPTISATSPEIAEAPTISATSPEIDEALVVSANSPEITETPTISATSPEIDEALVVSTNSPEITETPTISATSPEIDEALVVSTNSPEITETPTISATSPEIDEALVVSTNSPEITETPTISATSPEIAETPTVSTTSPEIAETPTVSTTSPEIAETPIVSATSPEIDEALVVSTNSPEITETPIVSAISPEIDEALVVSANSPEIAETPTFTAISPEIDEALVVSTNSPEITEIPTISATSPEIDEALVVSTNSPKIAEAPTVTATSPEIDEALVFSANSPEIVEKTSIFREIIDNEQTVESENPEISTADTWDNPDILDNPTSPQDEVSTVPKVEQNAIAENLPAPKGYATGGHVTDSRVENRQQIAPSDTVPAMLTPGEFVINTRDAQKNLPLLHHINTGGTPQDIILPSLQTNPTEPEATTSPETPTKVDSFSDTSLQRKSAETDSPEISNSLIPSSLGLNSNKQKLSILNSPQLHTLQNETIDVGESSPQYSSPPLIFRKANPSTHTPSQWSDTPSQWSSVEDLLNGNNDDFTSFNFNDGESNSQNYEFSHVSESPQVFAKHLPSPRGFANGGEVTPPDISREIQPITETIESTSSSSPEDEKDDTADLEALAREIYHRLRQRIEIERERHGGYSGRLPW